MKKLVILDNVTQIVHSYDVGEHVKVDDSLICMLGYHPNDCSWMCGNAKFVHHKDLLL